MTLSHKGTKRGFLSPSPTVASVFLVTTCFILLFVAGPVSAEDACMCKNQTTGKYTGTCTCGATQCTKSCPSGQTCACDFNVQSCISKNPCKSKSILEYAGPTLQIPIPTVEFSNAVVYDEATGGYMAISLPWTAQYITGIYKYGVGIAGMLAAVMMMVGGLLYVTAADSGRVATGKKMVVDAITGLILVLGAYLMLESINPSLVAWSALTTRKIDPIAFTDASTCEGEECTKGFLPENLDLATYVPPPAPAGAAAPSTGIKEVPVKYLPGSGSNLSQNQQNRSVTIDFSLFGKVDNRTGKKRDLKSISYVVIHNGGFNAKMNDATWKDRAASAHYTIERSGKIFQHVGDELVAWHCCGKNWAASNANSIGIELNIEATKNKAGKKVSCNALSENESSEAFLKACAPTDAQYTALKALLLDIASRTSFKLDEEHFVTHCESNKPSGHADPRAFDFSRLGLSNEVKRQSIYSHPSACGKKRTIYPFQ